MKVRNVFVAVAAAAAATVGVVAPVAHADAGDPTNVRYFAGQGWGGDPGLAERAAWNNAYAAAATAGFPAAACSRDAGPQFDQIGSSWMALVEIECFYDPHVTVPRVPWASAGDLGYCIGGEHCNEVRLTLAVGTASAKKQVGEVTVWAHDSVGGTTKAVLGLFADGVQVGGWQDVKKDGSALTFRPGRPVAALQFRSQQADGGTDETLIDSIIVR